MWRNVRNDLSECYRITDRVGRHHELITDFVSVHAEDLRRANDRLLVTKDENETTTTSRSDCPVTKWNASLWEAIPDVVTSSSSSSFNGDRRGGGDARKRPSLLLGQRCERSLTTVLPAHRRRRPCRWIAPRLASCCSRRPTPSETRSCIRRRRRRDRAMESSPRVGSSVFDLGSSLSQTFAARRGGRPRLSNDGAPEPHARGCLCGDEAIHVADALSNKTGNAASYLFPIDNEADKNWSVIVARTTEVVW